MLYKGHYYEIESTLEGDRITLTHNPSGQVYCDTMSGSNLQWSTNQVLDNLIYIAEIEQSNHDDNYGYMV